MLKLKGRKALRTNLFACVEFKSWRYEVTSILVKCKHNVSEVQKETGENTSMHALGKIFNNYKI